MKVSQHLGTKLWGILNDNGAFIYEDFTTKLDAECALYDMTVGRPVKPPQVPVPEVPLDDRVDEVCEHIADLLKSKNRKYGDAALNPKRIFSKSDTLEQLNVRIDDKLSRIANRQNDEDEDVELDLIGYLILKRIAKNK